MALKVWLLVAFVALLVAQHWLAALASTVQETQNSVLALHDELKALRDEIQRLSVAVAASAASAPAPGACGEN